MGKGKLLFLLGTLLLGINGAKADEVASANKLVDISFTNSTKIIVDNGTRANAQSKVGFSGAANYLENPLDKNYPYMGCTRIDASCYFYGTFDKGDELETAFQNSCTWEMLVRLDNLYDATNGGAAEKFFSCQEAGGWTFYNTQAGLSFYYLTTDGSTTTYNGAQYATSAGTLIAGKYYHIVATMDKATKKLKLSVNGCTPITSTRADGDWAIPNCGSTLKEKDIWFALGGDPFAQAATGGACENSNSVDVIFARIYDGALNDNAMKSLYTDDVKKYTEPKKPNTEDLIVDAVFNKDGAANTSAYNNLVPLDEMGTVTTAYNSEQQRYEAKFTANASQYFKFNLATEPSIMDQMADGFAMEVYCKVPSTTPGSVRPMGYEMSSYGGAIHLRTASQHLAWQPFTFGYDESSSYTKPGWRWTYSELPVTYTHYVMVYDRLNKSARFYENGELIDSRSLTLKECMALYWAPSAWLAVGGNASNWYRVNANCSSPYNGNISVARFWGKALSAKDVKELFASASSTTTSIQIDEMGYKAVCLPKNYTLPEGLTAYIIKQQDAKTATLTQLATSGQNIPYATPVILAGKAGVYNVTSLDITSAPQMADATGNILEGSYISKNATKNQLYVLKAGKKGLPILVKSDDETISSSCAWLPVSIETQDSVKWLVLGNDTIKDEKASEGGNSDVTPTTPAFKDTKTFAVMGNSISTYENYIPDGYAVYYATVRGYTAGVQVGDTYWMRLSRLTGLSYLTNSSWSGSRVASNAAWSAISAFTSDDRVNSVSRAGVPDYILIAGGTNDWSSSVVPLGEYSTTEFKDSTTFRGAYAMLLHKLKSRYPNIIPLCCSIFPRSQATTQANNLGWTQADANASIEHIAKQFGGYYIDCTGVPLGDDWAANTIDKLHPTAKGHAMLASCMANSLIAQGVISDTLKKSTEVETAVKLLDLEFDANGIVNKGTFQTKVGSNGTTATVYDAKNNTYYGCTKNTNTDYYYATYDADSKLATAMNNSATWEALVRLENLTDPTTSGSEVKFFSSDEDGGWSFFNTPNFVKFNYKTDAANVASFMKYEINDSTMVSGKFYHLVVTVDRTSHTMRFFVNGQLVATGTRIAKDLLMPACGSIERKKNMWLALGGDPTFAMVGGTAQNGAASTFVFARIYDGALTEAAAQALYNDEVKKFTEPESDYEQGLIMDAVFTKDGAVNKGEEPSIPIENVGNVTTAYNSEINAYEAQFTGNASQFFKYNVGNAPQVISKMADAYTIELYCNTETATPSASIRPVSFVDNYGAALHMNAKGNIAFGTLTYGYNLNKVFTKAPWTWTGEGTLTAGYNHYVISYDRKNGTSKLFINGEEKGSRSLYFKECNFMEWAPSEWMAIGGTPNSTYDAATKLGKYPFIGKISMVRLWDKAFNATEASDFSKVAQGSYSCTLSSSGYAAVCLPFNYVLPEGVTAYIVSDETASTITIKSVAVGGYVIPKGTPVILSGTAKTTLTLTPADPDAQSTANFSGNLLKGSYTQKAIGMGSYYLGTGNGMMKVSSTRTLTTFTSYLPSTIGTKTLRSFNKVTAINGVKATENSNEKYFDLEGREVLNPTRGIYIKNGQKIFVK